MLPENHTPSTCDKALSQAFEFLGKRWNGVIIGTLVNGPAGFAELCRAAAGISESMLSRRLTELTGVGLIERHVEDGKPVRIVYALTPAGMALSPALFELGKWASENLGDKCPAPSRKKPGT